MTMESNAWSVGQCFQGESMNNTIRKLSKVVKLEMLNMSIGTRKNGYFGDGGDFREVVNIGSM
jgi:hypothetical protein